MQRRTKNNRYSKVTFFSRSNTGQKGRKELKLFETGGYKKNDCD
jgi:hypothetical protein